jgi:hypothetical protein
VVVLKALYGMLQSALLYYKKFRKDIEDIGFNVNPYDPCIANRMVNGKQHTIAWHVDDVKSSHIDKTVNDEGNDRRPAGVCWKIDNGNSRVEYQPLKKNSDDVVTS